MADDLRAVITTGLGTPASYILVDPNIKWAYVSISH